MSYVTTIRHLINVRAPIAVLLCLMCLSALPAVAGEEKAWQLLREGKAVLILRHALAPGIGDPAEFRLGDCTTQRNLNAEGIVQAKRWKAYLSEQNIPAARVFTSEWCRAMDTAVAMDVGPVVPLSTLNSFFQGRFNREEQTLGVRSFVNGLKSSGAVVLVTHQVNIQALTGVFTTSNQGVIVALPLTASPEILASVTPAK